MFSTDTSLYSGRKSAKAEVSKTAGLISGYQVKMVKTIGTEGNEHILCMMGGGTTGYCYNTVKQELWSHGWETENTRVMTPDKSDTKFKRKLDISKGNRNIKLTFLGSSNDCKKKCKDAFSISCSSGITYWGNPDVKGQSLYSLKSLINTWVSNML